MCRHAHANPPPWKRRFAILLHLKVLKVKHGPHLTIAFSALFVFLISWNFVLQPMQFFRFNTKHVAVSLRSVLFVPQLKSFSLCLQKPFERKQLIHLFFLPLLSGCWRTHLAYVIFFKASNLSGLRLEPSGFSSPRLLSPIVITVSLLIAINRLPKESHTPHFSPFSPSTLNSSTASGL